MRLGVMTNLFYENREDGRGYIESLRRTVAAGFRVIDFNMCAMLRNATELNSDNWLKYANEIREEGERLGVDFSQAHLPFPKPYTRRKSLDEPQSEQSEFFREMLERAIIIAGILGVKWAVAHPVQEFQSVELDFESDLAYNHRIYDRFIDLAAQKGVGIAFENMCDIDKRRRFGVTPYELTALIESFGSDHVRACWDFGHGNRTYTNQIPPIKLIGKYLRATHVDDNMGEQDLHTIPFLGTAKWREIMPALKEIGYSGDFVFEVKFTSALPAPIKDKSAVLLRELGECLVQGEI